MPDNKSKHLVIQNKKNDMTADKLCIYRYPFQWGHVIAEQIKGRLVFEEDHEVTPPLF